jgi:hypothetical protein
LQVHLFLFGLGLDGDWLGKVRLNLLEKACFFLQIKPNLAQPITIKPKVLLFRVVQTARRRR